MGRRKGTLNKPKDPNKSLQSDTERIELIANLVLDFIASEKTQAAGEVGCKTT